MTTGMPLYPASFKDPAGFIFYLNRIYYRQINQAGAEDYKLLQKSGLYDKLVREQKLISHTESESLKGNETNWFKTLVPEQLPFITYPYEWCFDQLKDAAILTLEIQKESLDHGMSLKDATPFNIQWLHGRHVFIDILSFEKYVDSKPWVAYKQFCESFLAPLLLMKYGSPHLNKLLVNYPNGIPMPIASSLLPGKTKFNLNIYLHIHLQAKLQKKARSFKGTKKTRLELKQQYNIISNLLGMVKNLQLPLQKTIWNNYYDEAILSKEYLSAKKDLVKEFLSSCDHQTVLDMGANTGEFSMLAAKSATKVIAMDSDSGCMNDLYGQTKQKGIKNIFPVVADVTNPTPAIGWANTERESLWQRINADTILVLAMVHHLTISNNISFSMLASTLSQKCKYLIIEFVPLTDPRVQDMISHRKEIFDHYNENNFEASFYEYFDMVKRNKLPGAERILYLMKSK